MDDFSTFLTDVKAMMDLHIAATVFKQEVDVLVFQLDEDGMPDLFYHGIRVDIDHFETSFDVYDAPKMDRKFFKRSKVTDRLELTTFEAENDKVFRAIFPTDHLRLVKSMDKADYPDFFLLDMAMIHFEQSDALASKGKRYISNGSTNDPNMATALYIRDWIYDFLTKPF